jgi:hypothetical protein
MKQIENLTLRQVEKLGVDFLDFKAKTDLEKWLKRHSR